MKHLLLIIALISISATENCIAQTDTTTVIDTSIYRIVKADGTEFVGKILAQDAREIKVKLIEGREIIIPQHVIIKIEKLDELNYSPTGQYVGEDKFATRYFLTTNGLPVKKGEHYIQWNLYGPDFQFGLGKNVGVGVMTSWVATPIIFTAKKSFSLSDHVQLGLGTMLGTMGWAGLADTDAGGGGILPFASLSFGNRSSNFAITGGYGAVWQFGFSDTQGRALMSIAGMTKISKKISFIFDSFIMVPKSVEDTYTTTQYDPVTQTYLNIEQTYMRNLTDVIVLTPGIRWHQSEGKAFQFGFTGLIVDGEIIPFPIPTVQWFRSI